MNTTMHKTDLLERKIYAAICKNDGIKAKDIARETGSDHTTINQYLYKSPYMKELCYRDNNYLWHGLIRQMRPHIGLSEFTGYYGTAAEFLALSEEEWLAALTAGCLRIGRNLNNTRGLFHSFKDCRETMAALFSDIREMDGPDFSSWEIAFELRINRARYIRIYADVLLITKNRVFSLEFKMKDEILPEELLQAAKYSPYLEVLFGPSYDVIPALVLTRAHDLYSHEELPGSDAVLPVVSGDMLFNLIDEYLGLLQK